MLFLCCHDAFDSADSLSVRLFLQISDQIAVLYQWATLAVEQTLTPYKALRLLSASVKENYLGILPSGKEKCTAILLGVLMMSFVKAGDAQIRPGEQYSPSLPARSGVSIVASPVDCVTQSQSFAGQDPRCPRICITSHAYPDVLIMPEPCSLFTTYVYGHGWAASFSG